MINFKAFVFFKATLLLFSLISVVLAHSKGAGTCYAHRDILLRMSTPLRSRSVCPFKIVATKTPGVNAEHRIRLEGSSAIKGFLLYGEAHLGGPVSEQSLMEGEAPPRFGSFILPTFRRGKGIAQQHFLPECRNGTHTITHTNRAMKTSDDLDFEWKVENGTLPYNAIVFRAAVLVTHLEWYILPPLIVQLAEEAVSVPESTLLPIEVSTSAANFSSSVSSNVW